MPLQAGFLPSEPPGKPQENYMPSASLVTRQDVLCREMGQIFTTFSLDQSLQLDCLLTDSLITKVLHKITYTGEETRRQSPWQMYHCSL